jgi:hypothetical protein
MIKIQLSVQFHKLEKEQQNKPMKILLEDTYEPGVVVCVVIPGG